MPAGPQAGPAQAPAPGQPELLGTVDQPGRGAGLAALVARAAADPLRRLWTVGFCVLCSWELAQAPAGAARLAAELLAVLAVGCWLTVNLARQRRWPMPALAALLVVMGTASGVLVEQAPVAIGLLATVGVLAGWMLTLPLAAAVTATGLAALGVTALVTSMPVGFVWGGAAAALLGLLGGVTRAANQRRERDRAQQLLAEERLELQRGRAEVLAERNRVAREIHDVLAHSLGALAVQLDAADALLERGDQARAGELIRTSREMVLAGLAEARRAVGALREDDEQVELVELLQALLRREPVGSDVGELAVGGDPAQLAPSSAQALYRAAQEALANARKHAPGARVSVRLDFAGGWAKLAVANEAVRAPATSPAGIGASAGGGADPLAPARAVAGNGAATTTTAGVLAATGGGFGLRAMRERLELVGGSLAAGSQPGGGWLVVASVPLAGPAHGVPGVA